MINRGVKVPLQAENAGLEPVGVPETPGSAESGPDSSPVGSNRQRLTHSCGGCEAKWTSISLCHCSGCHRSFSGVINFDRHRAVTGGEHGTCLDPTELTNSKSGKHIMILKDGVWRSPEMTEAAKIEKFGVKA